MNINITKFVIMRNRIIRLNRTGYDPFIDYLKWVAILFVVLPHALPMHKEIASCLWIDQAVPLFLMIQVFHAYKQRICRADGDKQNFKTKI